jgi:hypothetical protein
MSMPTPKSVPQAFALRNVELRPIVGHAVIEPWIDRRDFAGSTWRGFRFAGRGVHPKTETLSSHLPVARRRRLVLHEN